MDDVVNQFVLRKASGDGDIQILAEDAFRTLRHKSPIVLFPLRSASSALLRSVMSSAVACISFGPPSTSFKNAPLNNTQTGVPSFRRSRIS
jgi:hypothetical protein